MTNKIQLDANSEDKQSNWMQTIDKNGYKMTTKSEM